MADNKSMVVPATQEPTFWNRDAIVGFVIGGWAWGLGAIPGLIIGGMIGKSRMENEKTFGKIVSEPTFWNKSIFTGLLVGGLIGSAVIIGAMVGLPFIMDAASLAKMTLPIIGAGVGIELIGGIMGGLSGKERLTKEYNEAKAYVAEHGNYTPGQEKAPKVSRETQLSPEEAQALYDKLTPGQKKFVDAEMARDEQQAVAAR